MQTKKATLVSRFMLIATLIAIFILAVTRVSLPGLENVSDKVNHLAAFFVLALLADFSWPASGFNKPKMGALLCYGLAIEVTQYFLSYRYFSVFDLGADAAGLFLYRMSVPLLKTVSPFRVRWEVDEVIETATDNSSQKCDGRRW